MHDMSKLSAIIAALDWVGCYEAENTQEKAADEYGGRNFDITLESAVQETRDHYHGKAKKVTASVVSTRYPAFPRDMVAAYFLLSRMYDATERA